MTILDSLSTVSVYIRGSLTMTGLKTCSLIFLSPALACGAELVEFNRDIRPILTKNCTACHGGVKAAGGISFIYRDMALAQGESGKRAITPGSPDTSEMIRRIRSTDPDEVMPQPKHGPPLPAEQIAMLERWIAQGAEWSEHWAFVPPRENKIEKLSDETWPTVSLDRFVLQRLDREQLKPSPEAPPAEWLRRAAFDLTGLPPSPAELAVFLTKHASDPTGARAEEVERLLASPHFGERWAAVWLDLARYADTYGFEKDPGRDIWPYRDWVIRAFNADMPYDRFTIEQLAGDLLPDANVEQRLATAFHRNTQTNTEGGTDDEEFRVAAVIDRVSTTWTAWQATTFGCVQCHDHPYDPIRHDEFYQFMAFFNNTEDHDLDSDFPKMKVTEDSSMSEEASRLEIRMRVMLEKLHESGRVLANSTEDWKPFAPDAFAPSHGKLAISSDGTIRSEGTLPVGALHKISGTASAFNAMRLRIFPDSDDPKKWPERGSLVTKFEVNLIDAAGTATKVKMKEVISDRLGGSFTPGPEGNVGGFPKLDGPRWYVFVPEKPVDTPAGARIEISLLQKEQTAGNQATPVRQFSIEFSTRPEWITLVNDPQRDALWKERQQLAAQYKGIKGTMVPVMVEGPGRETRVFARGNRLSKEHAVEPGLPELFQKGNSGREMNRLDMAKWIASRDNPLTSRVMVNRLWGELFGIGIVETAEDFGTSGTPPSHPDLLDHLALRFQNELNWSVKAMLREIVLSSTYRQTHRASPQLVTRDPANRLLARGPRNRLSAEMVRDQALAVAGILTPKMHGPPVFPPQPDGVWSSAHSNAKWMESKGEDRLRRGIYTYSKRTSGFPGFLTFDAPSRDLCNPRRLTSNTPLQALVTLNDPAHIEAAKGLAKRMNAHSDDLSEQLAHGFLLATQQTASPLILAELSALFTDSEAAYRQQSSEAALLAANPKEAALVLVANTILNLDPALTR